jgi:hypothetical protein
VVLEVERLVIAGADCRGERRCVVSEFGVCHTPFFVRVMIKPAANAIGYGDGQTS